MSSPRPAPPIETGLFFKGIKAVDHRLESMLADLSVQDSLMVQVVATLTVLTLFALFGRVKKKVLPCLRRFQWFRSLRRKRYFSWVYHYIRRYPEPPKPGRPRGSAHRVVGLNAEVGTYIAHSASLRIIPVRAERGIGPLSDAGYMWLWYGHALQKLSQWAFKIAMTSMLITFIIRGRFSPVDCVGAPVLVASLLLFLFKLIPVWVGSELKKVAVSLENAVAPDDADPHRPRGREVLVNLRGSWEEQLNEARQWEMDVLLRRFADVNEYFNFLVRWATMNRPDSRHFEMAPRASPNTTENSERGTTTPAPSTPNQDGIEPRSSLDEMPLHMLMRLRTCAEDLILGHLVVKERMRDDFSLLSSEKWVPTPVRLFPTLEEQSARMGFQLTEWRNETNRSLEGQTRMLWDIIHLQLSRNDSSINDIILLLNHHLITDTKQDLEMWKALQNPLPPIQVYFKHVDRQRNAFILELVHNSFSTQVHKNTLGLGSDNDTTKHLPSATEHQATTVCRQSVNNFCAQTTVQGLHHSTFGKNLQQLNERIDVLFPPDFALPNLCLNTLCPTLTEEEVRLLLRYLHLRHLTQIYGLSPDEIPSADDVKEMAMSLYCTSDPAATIMIPYRWHAMQIQLADIGGPVPQILCNWCGASAAVFYNCVQGNMGQRNTVITARNSRGFDLCFPCTLFVLKRGVARLLSALDPEPAARVPFRSGAQTAVAVKASELRVCEASGEGVVRVTMSLRPHSLQPVLFALDPSDAMPATEPGSGEAESESEACTAACCRGERVSYRYLQRVREVELEWVYRCALPSAAHGGATVVWRRRCEATDSEAEAEAEAAEPHSEGSPEARPKCVKVKSYRGSAACVICQEDLYKEAEPEPLPADVVETPCGHLFHRECFSEWEEECYHNKVPCPVCRSVTKNVLVSGSVALRRATRLLASVGRVRHVLFLLRREFGVLFKVDPTGEKEIDVQATCAQLEDFEDQLVKVKTQVYEVTEEFGVVMRLQMSLYPSTEEAIARPRLNALSENPEPIVAEAGDVSMTENTEHTMSSENKVSCETLSPALSVTMDSSVITSRVARMLTMIEELDTELSRLETEQKALLRRPLLDTPDTMDEVELELRVPAERVRYESREAEEESSRHTAAVDVVLMTTWMANGVVYNPTQCASCEVITIRSG